MPRVSIIIPCYNAAPWIEETIRSALAQTHADREIIVIDDGSTDDSLRRARTFEPAGVRVVTQRNAGASAARNHGLRLATGDFIQYLDADDLLAPDKIERQLREFGRDPSTRLTSASWARFQSSIIDSKREINSLSADLSATDFIRLALQHHHMMHPAAWLVPTAVCRAAGGWNEDLSLNDDGEYFARIVLAAGRIRHVRESITFYRSGLAGSLSRSRSERAWRSQLRSTALTVDHMLAASDTRAARQAAADAIRRDCLDAYPFCHAIRAEMERKIAVLGGSRLCYQAGPRYALLAKFIGWKMAKRIRNQLG